ncbi:MAG: complex I NDUFA9 subunit family protein [Candidatus Obscuribacterales bacterium]|nr:complex I NDUFA9 subunit family protein [Candidatus Obscuribacterales bacterium]
MALILVTGGTGFVGSRVIPALLEEGYQVRMMSRGNVDWTDTTMAELKRAGVDVIVGDVRDPRKLLEAVDGAKVIINLIGITQQTADTTFEDIHVEALKGLIEVGQKYGVERFIHVSCLGASQYSENACFKTKAQGEEIVKASNFIWTILRPSLTFAEDSIFLNRLVNIVKASPVIPVVDSGLNRLAPISVDDVADCIVQSIYNKHTAEQTYDLVGPNSYSISEFLQLIAQAKGKNKPVLHVPSSMVKALGNLVTKVKPDNPLNDDLVNLLKADSVGDKDAMLATFAVKWKTFEECLTSLED